MSSKRKFSLFISSTYEDLKDERQALLGVALESGFIPVGMEQFHGAPVNQWDVITKMIDECDFYMLVVGGRYGSIDESAGMSYTEKEYKYAKDKHLPVLVLIKKPSSITEDKKDVGDKKYEKIQRLDDFRSKVEKDGNTVDYFVDLNGLKYAASQTLKNAIGYADENAGWVRYKDVVHVINEEVAGRNKTNGNLGEQQREMIENMKSMLAEFSNRLTEVETNQARQEELPLATKDDIDQLFRVEGHTLILGNSGSSATAVIGKDDVGNIPVESAFLLVYAAEGDGQILKTQSLSLPARVSTFGKQFMANDSKRESARWVEALDRLVEWGWVKPVGYKGEIFELTGTGYKKADWLKESMDIDTNKEPLEELKEFDY